MKFGNLLPHVRVLITFVLFQILLPHQGHRQILIFNEKLFKVWSQPQTPANPSIKNI